MGYRSNVVLVMNQEGVEELKAALKRLTVDAGKEVKELFNNADKHLSDQKSGVELWYWGDVKWYADYPDVSFLENFLFLDADKENYRFIRLGEDYDDLEEAGLFFDDPFDLYVAREICFANPDNDREPDIPSV